MPSVNMIAPRRAEKRRLELNIRRLVAAILLEIVLIVGVSAIMVTRICTTRSNIQKVDVELAKLQPTVHKIEKCEKMVSELKPKLDTLQGAKGTTLIWCRIMDNLSSCLPARTWLTRVNTDVPKGDQKGLEIKLTGIAANQQTVGDAMLKMHDAVRDFSSVDLHFSQKSATAGQAIEFEIGAAIGTPDTAPDATQEVKKN